MQLYCCIKLTHQLESPPGIAHPRYLKKHKLRRPEGVNGLQRDSGDDAGDKPTPQDVALVAESKRVKLFQTKQDTAQGAPEGDRNTSRCGSRE